MEFMVAGIENELIGERIFLADRFEESGVPDRLVLGCMALGDDGDFLGWEL